MDNFVLTIEEIKHMYNMFNIQFFSGRLPSVSYVNFIYDNTIKEAAGYTFCNDVASKKDSSVSNDFLFTIAINPDSCKTERHIGNVLAHEMIHIYQMTMDKERYSDGGTWNMTHNRTFEYKMRYINNRAKELGIDIKVGLCFDGE